MRLLDLICKKLGVEVGKRWIGSDGYDYKITEEGLIGFYYPTSDDRENFDIDVQLWVNIMLGELKPVWKPKIDDVYFTIKLTTEPLVVAEQWGNTNYDNRLIERGLAFKTKEEAIAAANKMLHSLKEDKHGRS